MNKEDLEILAFTKLKEAIEPLKEEERKRVLEWAIKKFLKSGIEQSNVVGNPSKSNTSSNIETEIKAKIDTKGKVLELDFDDLIEIDNEGTIDLHIRDFKATTKIDCANRLVHTLIYLHEKLTGNKEIGAPIVNKFLEDWRLYDSNIRKFMAHHKGIKNRGTKGAQRFYYLDKPGKKEAEKFIIEIRDEGIVGKFDPAKGPRKRREKAKKEGEKVED